jgi:hypothetical protein
MVLYITQLQYILRVRIALPICPTNGSSSQNPLLRACFNSPCRVLEVDRGSEKASNIFPANEVFIRPVSLESYQ